MDVVIQRRLLNYILEEWCELHFILEGMCITGELVV